MVHTQHASVKRFVVGALGRRSWLPAACCFLCLLSQTGCSSTAAPRADRIQAAVDQALDATKLSGQVRVLGVQQNPGESAAVADLNFDQFTYKANNYGIPVAKTAEPPKEPDINSPDFYAQMATLPSRQISVRNYSGQGRAALRRYNDGRWVLTEIQFAMINVTANQLL